MTGSSSPFANREAIAQELLHFLTTPEVQKQVRHGAPGEWPSASLGREQFPHLHDTLSLVAATEGRSPTADDVARWIWNLVVRCVGTRRSTPEPSRTRLEAVGLLLDLMPSEYYVDGTSSGSSPGINRRRELVAALGLGYSKRSYGFEARAAMKDLADALCDHLLEELRSGVGTRLIPDPVPASDAHIVRTAPELEERISLAERFRRVRMTLLAVVVAVAVTSSGFLLLRSTSDDRLTSSGTDNPASSGSASPPWETSFAGSTPPTLPPPSVSPSTDDRPAPELSGHIEAINKTIGQEQASSSVEAVLGDEIAFSLQVTNTGSTMAGPLTFTPRLYTPREGSKGAVNVVDFLAREGVHETQSVVTGAVLYLSSPETCDQSGLGGSQLAFAGITAAVDREAAEIVPQPPTPSPSTFATSVAADTGELLGSWKLGTYLDPGASMTVTGRIVRTQHVGGAPQIDGSGVRVAVRDQSPAEYADTIEAAVGDSVRIQVQLHNGSCSPLLARVNLRARVRSYAARGFLTVSARADNDGGSMQPPSTKFSAATINVKGSVPARLRLIPDSTELWGGSCGRPYLMAHLDDRILTRGVRVEVPGLMPREDCELHIRWVAAEFELVL